MQMPYRKLALLLIDRKHSVDEIDISFRLEDAVERHGSAISIPKGEYRIGFISGVGMDVSVRSAV